MLSHLNIGKLFFATTMTLVCYLQYLISPPLHKEIFTLLFLISLIPIVFILWTLRGKILNIKKGLSLLIFFLLTILFASIIFYAKEYKYRIYFDSKSKDFVYLPLNANKLLVSKIKKVGGTIEAAVHEYGIDQIKEEVKNGNYETTNAYFLIITLVTFSVFTMLMVILYLEKWIDNIFFDQKEFLKERKEILDLLKNDHLNKALNAMINSPLEEYSKIKSSAMIIFAQNKELEEEYRIGTINFSDYTLHKNRIRKAILNLVS